jgi:hypothetical protein
MRWIVGLVVIILMAADTGIRGCGIIPIMALVAGCGNMCAGKGPVSIMDCECSRFPSGNRSMAIGTGSRNPRSLVIRICRGSIVSLVAANTGIYSRGIIAVMALVAGSSDMGAGQGIVSIVDREGGRFPARVGCMAIGTGVRDVGSHVVRICRGSKVGLVTTDTCIYGRSVIAIVALVAGCARVCASEGIVSIVDGESGRFPSGNGSMAIGAGRRNIGNLVVRI